MFIFILEFLCPLLTLLLFRSSSRVHWSSFSILLDHLPVGPDLAYVSSTHAYKTTCRYPITSRARLREDLSTALFTLAKYSSSVHATVTLRLRTSDSNAGGKSGRDRGIDQMREKLLGDVFSLLLKLREDFAYIAWEPNFGGKFPKLQYKAILDQMQRCVLFMTFAL